MNISTKITALREAAGWSKNKLAKEAGISQAYVSQIEAGKKQPTVDVLYRICTALGITLAEFFAEEAPDMPPELRQVINKAKKLTPRQLKILNDVLDEWIDPSKGE